MRAVANLTGVLRGDSPGRRMFAPLVTVGAVTVLVKLAGAVKVVIIARYFGLGDAADAFLIAFASIMFSAEAISAATNASLIPMLVAMRERGDAEAVRTVLSTITLLTLLQLASISTVLLLFGGQILSWIASGFDAHKLEVARSLLAWMLPVLILSGITATWRGVLNSVGEFAIPAASPVFVPLLTIVAIVLKGSAADEYTLVSGTLAGAAAEAIVIGYLVWRQGLPVLPTRFAMNESSRAALQQYGPMLMGACLLSGSAVVNNSMAAMLGAGSVAAFTYGTKVVTVILAIGSAAIATVALPHFSRLAARCEWTLISETNKTFYRLILLITVPLTGALAYASEPLIPTLYQRGSFTDADVLLVAKVQSWHILQLTFMMLSALAYRLISSLRSNEVLMWGGALHLMSTVALNYVCMQRLGIAGIALGSSIAAAIYYWYLLYNLTRLLKTNTLYRVARATGFVST